MHRNPDAAAAGSARTDRELMESLAEDYSPLEHVYDRYAGLVYGIALSALRNPEDAQDLAQEIFLALCRENRYDPERGALGAYLATMTRTRAIDRLRARGRKVRLLGDVYRADLPTSPQPRTPLERFSMAECSERVRAALDELPENHRRVLEMAYYRGLSQSEIAADLGASLGTVKSWARRGLHSLKDALGDLIE